LKTQNCSATGQTCGFLQAISGYGCTGSTNSGNNCGNEVTAAGLCVNNYWVACSGGTIQEFNCSEMGLYCMYAPDLAKYQCMANPGCEGLCPSNQRCQQDGTCGCDGIDVNGVCEANSLVWCSGGTTLTTANCAANGDTCEVNAGGFADCTSPPVTDNCNGVTAAGVCNGNQLSTCSNGVLTTTNCAAQGKICGSTPPPSVAYACIDDPNADDCNGISAAGTCVGNVFTYCENGSLSTQDCGATGQTCGQSPPPVAAYGCQGTPSSGGCGNEVTAKGLCIGNSVVACSSDNVTSFDCSEVGAYCMYDPALEKYQCLGPQGCENSCPANQRCEKGGTCGCDGITVDGVCENNTLVWCGGSTLVIEDCASSGETCKVDNTSYASCQP
jgi:hypothetical protein